MHVPWSSCLEEYKVAAAKGAVDREFSLYFGGLGLREWSQRRENDRGMPGVDSQVLATSLDPFRTIFVDLGPDGCSAT